MTNFSKEANFTVPGAHEDFDWDSNPSGRAINTKLKRVPNGMKVYCHEPYAQTLLDLYNNFFGRGATASRTASRLESSSCSSGSL